MPDAFDPTILITSIGSVVSTVIGFFVLWNIIRVSRRDTLLDQQKSLGDMEGRLKEHIGNKLDLVDTKIDSVRDEIKKNDASYRRELDGFAKWIDRVERNVASNIQRVTGTRRYYNSATQQEEEE